jgi:hypothetical protein
LKLYLATAPSVHEDVTELQSGALQLLQLWSLAEPAFGSIVFCGVAVKNLENEQGSLLAT